MKSQQIIDFSGKLDMDTSPEKMNPANYTNAKNVQFLTNDTESTTSHIPMLGNEAAFDLGSVAIQNKTFRLYIQQEAVAPHNGHLWFFTETGIGINNDIPPYHLAAPPFYH